MDSMAFSPDGTRLVSGGREEGENDEYFYTIDIWDVGAPHPTRQILSGPGAATPVGHSDAVVSVAFSPDGTRIASGSADNTVRVWDVATWTCSHTLEGHSDYVHSVAFSPDGTRIASGSDDQTVRVWNVETGACEATLMGHTDLVLSVAFSPDGTRIVSGSADQTVRFWDATTGECLTASKIPFISTSVVTFSPDTTRIAIWGESIGIFKYGLRV